MGSFGWKVSGVRVPFAVQGVGLGYRIPPLSSGFGLNRVHKGRRLIAPFLGVLDKLGGAMSIRASLTLNSIPNPKP